MHWKFTVLASTFLLLNFLSPQSGALTKATNYLVSKQLSKACHNGQGRVLREAIIERDITGDGKLDLILDLSGFECDRGKNEFCETQNCTIVIYIRKGRHLRKVGDYITENLSVSRGSRPIISMWDAERKPYSVRWTGERFKSVKEVSRYN